MKKPKSVIIQGHTYKILSDKSKKCLEVLDGVDGPNLKGCFLPYEQLICIDSDLLDDFWYSTLIHECLHSFLHHMIHTNETDDETLVEYLTIAIFTFLRENKLWKIKN